MRCKAYILGYFRAYDRLLFSDPHGAIPFNIDGLFHIPHKLIVAPFNFRFSLHDRTSQINIPLSQSFTAVPLSLNLHRRLHFNVLY